MYLDNVWCCIKVIYNCDYGGDKEIWCELSYYVYLFCYLIDWSVIFCYYGMVEIDCGIGYVYDMIIDFNGVFFIILIEFVV